MNSLRLVTIICMVLILVATVVAIGLYFGRVWPYTNTDVFDPQAREWVDPEPETFIENQRSPNNVCGPYCGGTYQSPEIREIYLNN